METRAAPFAIWRAGSRPPKIGTRSAGGEAQNVDAIKKRALDRDSRSRGGSVCTAVLREGHGQNRLHRSADRRQLRHWHRRPQLRRPRGQAAQRRSPIALRYELVVLDDECKPDTGVQVATKAVADKSIVAVTIRGRKEKRITACTSTVARWSATACTVLLTLSSVRANSHEFDG